MFGFGPKIDISKITDELQTGTAILVDVRGDGEWQSGHAAGALHLPVDKISRGEVPTKDTSKKIYLYCASGGRSSMAARTLKQKGYDVENIGSLGGWRAAGGAIQ